MDGSNNVIYLRRPLFSRDDTDVIETIMQVHCGGEEVSIDKMEVTTESMASIRDRLVIEGGTQPTESAAWRFPVMQLRYEAVAGKGLVLVVIDQGQHRVFKHRIEQK